MTANRRAADATDATGAVVAKRTGRAVRRSRETAEVAATVAVRVAETRTRTSTAELLELAAGLAERLGYHVDRLDADLETRRAAERQRMVLMRQASEIAALRAMIVGCASAPAVWTELDTVTIPGEAWRGLCKAAAEITADTEWEASGGRPGEV